MKYCSSCGHPVEHRIPEGDNRHRFVCPNCETIHYQNPNIVAGTVPVWEGRILLCRRAIEPRYGYWTLPAGFMENAETTLEAAARETREEALAEVTIDDLYTIIHVPHIDQVHMFYRATLKDGSFGAGEESLETQLFRIDEIPWDEISFPTVKRTLEHFVADLENNQFPLHVSDIRYQPRKKALINRSSEIFHPEDLIRRFFVWMRRFKCIQRPMNQMIRAHQLDLILTDNLQFATLTQKWLTAIQRPELAVPKTLPCTGIVISDTPRPYFKQRSLGLLYMTLWYEIAQLIHHHPSSTTSHNN